MPALSTPDLPLEFDAGFYRSLYPDLVQLDDAAIAQHYRLHGEPTGRIASPAAVREGFLERLVQQQGGDLLEVGPFNNPLLRGAGVFYLDMLDAAALRARAESLGLDPAGCPDHIDFVGSTDLLDRRFAGVLSSHSIEHQPDLVHHLQSIGRALDPGGRYFLIVPDKRFCFDAHIPQSTIAGVLQAHHERRTRHALASVIEHRALTVHNDPTRHWVEPEPEVAPADQALRAQSALREFAEAGDDYLDVHAWYFTPRSFRTILQVLVEMGLSELRPVRVYDTPHARLEFCAVLEKPADAAAR